ncbi:MAG: ATPase [SAR324 cluster bacterium]|uniref:ATPase n=1 Tax=SAR324 cluster bacterium TaxID=2024889 RepID=A0A2A4T6J4_9DELT|nr:MAG: ATPase [SAR324 cluster bacterium]
MNKIVKNILEVNQLHKNYGDFTALNEVSISARKGEILGLLGPNGAGKTTFISILTGLIAPTRGSASLFGLDIQKHALKVRQQVGLVPQEIVNHGFFTINQVLEFQSGYYGIRNNQKHIDYLLERLALTEHKNKLVSELSGGMRRRLLIAKALVHSPSLLLLDEPTAGVDVDLRNTLWDFVRDLNRQNVTVLLTTHYLQEAEELCDRIAVLHHGTLISLDNTQEMIKNLTDREVKIKLASSTPWPGMPAGLEIEDKTIKCRIAHGDAIGKLLTKLKIPMEQLEDITISEGNLEEAFVNLLQQHRNKPQ